MKNVLVVGVTKDEGTRKAFENAFVKQLQAKKVTAVPSYTVFPGEQIPSKEAMITAMKEKNIDTVLITRVASINDVQNVTSIGHDKNYVLAYVRVGVGVGPRPYYGSYWGYYGYSYGYVHSPDYTVTTTEVVLETNLYNAASEALEWNAKSKTTTQGDQAHVIQSFIPAIVNKMANDKLFG